jgi:membrane protein YdbS with pleckstrin-like domain
MKKLTKKQEHYIKVARALTIGTTSLGKILFLSLILLFSMFFSIESIIIFLLIVFSTLFVISLVSYLVWVKKIINLH